MMVPACGLEAQCILTFKHNAPEEGHKMKKIKVQIPEPGTAGDNAVWDFSGLEPEGKPSSLYFFEDSTSSLCGSESRTIRKYDTDSIHLWIVGFETPVSKTTYAQPLLSMEYPFCRGDCQETPFMGRGFYDNNNPLMTAGFVRSEADASGILITPSRDTLRHVLRVHTVRLSSVTYGSNDEGKKNEEKEEIYEWFARGYRYPLLESHVVTTYAGGKATREKKLALYCPPEEQDKLEDPLNKTLREADSLAMGKTKAKAAYKLTVASGKAFVTYLLHHPSPISALLSDSMGIVYRETTFYARDNEGVVELSLEGLPRGEYILHIGFGNESYSEKIII